MSFPSGYAEHTTREPPAFKEKVNPVIGEIAETLSAFRTHKFRGKIARHEELKTSSKEPANSRKPSNKSHPNDANWMDMKSAVDDLSQLIQDNSNMLRELSQTLTSYVSQHAAAATAADPQDGEHKDVDIQQLVPIINELRHKFLQQEVKVEQIKEQVLLKDNIILEREETLRELQTKAQQLEETIMKQRKAVKQECEAEIRNLPTKKTLIYNLASRPSHSPARDCTDIRLQGETLSGVYQIFPESSPSGVNVMCQMEEEAAWTVFLARHRQTVQENFTRTWQDYKTGFGDPHAEYWLGNDNLHALTAGDHSYRLKVVATNLRGEHQSAEWDTFAVADESNK
nr:angiopoietin-1-like [Cherax quadricarinatus]